MTVAAILAPSKRQILVNVGTRQVVFGPQPSEPPRFVPEGVTDGNAGIERLVRVAGMTTRLNPDGDLELIDEDGSKILVDLKIRERDPTQRDLDRAEDWLVSEAESAMSHEVWFFNVERLRLFMMHRDSGALQVDELKPIDVWEKSATSLVRRKDVLAEVNDWAASIDRLYADVRRWLADHADLSFEQDRAVTIQEQLMQEFDVEERDLPILDIVSGSSVVLCFVPRALWLADAWGWVDIITHERTHALRAVGSRADMAWRIVDPEDRRRTDPFGKDALLSLLAAS